MTSIKIVQTHIDVKHIVENAEELERRNFIGRIERGKMLVVKNTV
jgi:hypothetical protein